MPLLTNGKTWSQVPLGYNVKTRKHKLILLLIKITISNTGKKNVVSQSSHIFSSKGMHNLLLGCQNGSTFTLDTLLSYLWNQEFSLFHQLCTLHLSELAQFTQD